MMDTAKENGQEFIRERGDQVPLEKGKLRGMGKKSLRARSEQGQAARPGKSEEQTSSHLSRENKCPISPI